MGRYADLEKSLLEAIEIEHGTIPIVSKDEMPAPTFVASDKEKILIEEFVTLRKKKNISQKELAAAMGSKQQVISRVENLENSPSLKLFYSMVDALGYELRIVEKADNI